MPKAKEQEVSNFGAGSGGGPSDKDGDHFTCYRGAYAISANQVEFRSEPQFPPSPEQGAYLINVFSPGLPPGVEGFVNVRGSAGVRVTAGPPPLPPATSSTNGIEMAVGETQSITLERGLVPEGSQNKIEMAPGQITVDGGAGTITIQSLTEITLQVAGGVASIKLTPAGLILQGPIIQIN